MDAISTITGCSHTKNIEDYGSVHEIRAELEVLAQENFLLSQTAEILERYLRKRSPGMLIGIDKFIERRQSSVRSSIQANRSMSISIESPFYSPVTSGVRTSINSSSTRGLPSRSNAQSFGSCKINPATKVDLVEREIEECRMVMDKLQRKFKSAKFMLETEEENLKVEIEILDEKKIALEQFLNQSTDSKSGKVFNDKYLRFLEQELETGDRVLRKMELKTKSMLTEYKRISAQQQQKLELRERLHPVDIEKLLIENEELLEILELKNKNLQYLKKAVGRKGQNLVSVKSKLNDTILSLKALKQDSEQKEKKCKYMEVQQVCNQSLLRVAELNNLHMKKLNIKYKSPEVHSYLQVQSKLGELKSEKVKWERRRKYQKQQISLLEHEVKQLSSTHRPSHPRIFSTRRLLRSTFLRLDSVSESTRTEDSFKQQIVGPT